MTRLQMFGPPFGGALLVASCALAQTTIPVATLEKTVEGQTISMPISLRGEISSQPQVIVDLSDGLAKLNAIIHAAWTNHRLDDSIRTSYRHTNWSIDGASLRLKVHFRVHPPIVPNSDGSIVLTATPTVENGVIGLSASAGEFRISNDATRLAAAAWNLDRRIPEQINVAIRQLLSVEEAKFRSPAAVNWLGLQAKGAGFAIVDQRPEIIVVYEKK